MRRHCSSPDSRPLVGVMHPHGPKPLVMPSRRRSRERQPCNTISIGRRAGSFADDLNTRRGIVSGRVALLPRSTEIQPCVASIRPSPPTHAPPLLQTPHLPPQHMPQHLPQHVPQHNSHPCPTPAPRKGQTEKRLYTFYLRAGRYALGHTM